MRKRKRPQINRLRHFKSVGLNKYKADQQRKLLNIQYLKFYISSNIQKKQDKIKIINVNATSEMFKIIQNSEMI